MKGPLDLLTRLCNIADAMVETRAVQMSDAAIRQIRDDVQYARLQPCEEKSPIDYEASCLIECIAELAYARSDRDAAREDRAKMYINTLRGFMRADLDRATRAAAATEFRR
jgi:hypothetical protein